MFLIFSKCVCVFIFTVIAHKDMFDTVISGVPWQQEAFYHQPIDTTWWMRAPPTLPPLFAPDRKALGCLSLAEEEIQKGGSQVMSSAPEPSLLLLKCGSLVPTRACVQTCFLRSVPMAELSALYLFCWVLAQVNHDALKRGGLDLEMAHVVSITGDHHLKASLAKTDQSLSLSDSFAQI